MDAIAVSGLCKRFGSTVALDHLDLSVSTGEVHGFLGPNGAGKSVTIRTLLGLLRKDSGSVSVLGHDPWSEAPALHRRLAYVPGDVTLWPNLSGGEVIDLLTRLRGGVNTARRDELLERFALDPTKRGRTYSKGNRQKVALVAALASDVELLLLDEPTSGLDPLMEQVFRETVAQAAERGCTVLLSSHILSEVEALCDRVTIIRNGRAVESGTLTSLRHLTRTSVAVVTAHPITGLGELPGVHDVVADDGVHTGGQIRTRFAVDTEHIGATLAYLGEFGIVGLTSTPPTLEEMFLRHYDSTPDAPAVGAVAGGSSGTGR